MEFLKRFIGLMAQGWRKLRSWPVLCHFLVLLSLVAFIVVVSHYALLWGTRHDISRTVPDFTGLSVEHAQRFAEPRDLQIVVSDSLYLPEYSGGIILDQLPYKGEKVKPGRKIYVTINSFRQQEVRVPYVVGRSLRDAKNRLEASKLTIAHLEYVEDEVVQGSKNNVLAEFVGGREVDTESFTTVCGTGVTLQVSGLGQSTTVPELVGRPFAEAKSRLWEAGLNVGDVSCDKSMSMLEQNKAIVYLQSVMPGDVQMLGSYIALGITLDDAVVEAGVQALELRREELRLEQLRADSLAAAARAQDSIARANRDMAADNFFF